MPLLFLPPPLPPSHPSRLSFADSVRSPPTISLFIFPHSPGFHFSRDNLLLSPPRFSSALLFFSPSHPPPPDPRPLQHRISRAATRATSRYPLTCRRFFTRALFLLSEGHWNRIKLYAGFSMPPFPPVAMKGGIRHGGRRKMG